jgi:hypothetical protein
VKTRLSGLAEDETRVSSGRLWTWRISSVVFGLGACGFLVWANVRTDMSLLTFCCLAFFVITLATLVAIYGETQYNREALEGQDLELYRRIKRAQLPHVIGIMCAMSLYPVLYALSRQYGHQHAGKLGHRLPALRIFGTRRAQALAGAGRYRGRGQACGAIDGGSP